jgi:hypothetical protein
MPNIQAQIDRKISGGKTSLVFPLKDIKYHTTISIEDWRFHNPVTGQIGLSSILQNNADAIQQIIDFLDSNNQLSLAKLGSSIGIIRQRIQDILSNNVSFGNDISFAKTEKQIRADVRLPLPLQLLDHHAVKYDPKPMLPVESLVRNFPIAGPVGGWLIDTAQALTGLAPNEYHTILFDRPEFKTHELAFKLSPKSHEESEQIQKIFVVLNNATSPSLALSGTLFRFPKVINISFRPRPGFLFKFKPAVITSVTTNFAPSGKKAFYDSMYPESVHLVLRVTEIEYWINENETDLLEGDYNLSHSNEFASN